MPSDGIQRVWTMLLSLPGASVRAPARPRAKPTIAVSKATPRATRALPRGKAISTAVPSKEL